MIRNKHKIETDSENNKKNELLNTTQQPLKVRSVNCKLLRPSNCSMTRGVPPQITAAPLEIRVFPYGDAVTAGETHRNNTAGHRKVVLFISQDGCTVFCWHTNTVDGDYFKRLGIFLRCDCKRCLQCCYVWQLRCICVCYMLLELFKSPEEAWTIGSMVPYPISPRSQQCLIYKGYIIQHICTTWHQSGKGFTHMKQCCPLLVRPLWPCEFWSFYCRFYNQWLMW